MSRRSSGAWSIISPRWKRTTRNPRAVLVDLEPSSSVVDGARTGAYAPVLPPRAADLRRGTPLTSSHADTTPSARRSVILPWTAQGIGAEGYPELRLRQGCAQHPHSALEYIADTLAFNISWCTKREAEVRGSGLECLLERLFVDNGEKCTVWARP